MLFFQMQQILDSLSGRIKFLGTNSKGEYVTNKAPMHDSMIVIFK